MIRTCTSQTENKDIASYSHDNTPYVSRSNLDPVIDKLEESTNNLFQWFGNNHMKANADKCHLLVTDTYETSANINLKLKAGKKKAFRYIN